MYVVDTRAVSDGKVDTIKPASATKDLLCRVDIHHREAAAKCARQATRLHDASHGESLAPVHRVEIDLAVDAEPMFLREVGRDDQRIGLRQEHEGIIDDAFLAAFKVVIAQAAVTGHVYREDQQTARVREGRIHDRFDHGHRHAHIRVGLDLLENFLGKPRLASRNLQLCRASDPVDGLIERVQHGLIGRMHSHEDRHSEHDPGKRQNAFEPGACAHRAN